MSADKTMAGAMTVTADQPPTSAAQRIDELGRIIMAYSEVTERLQESHERLEKTVAALRGELGEKNRQLERRNRLAALGEMAAGMAHEIRNPLGAIQLYASLLAKDVQDRPPSLAVVGKIASGVRRLEALVSQVLAFTREIRASRVPMDLRQTLEQALELAAPALEAQGATGTIDGPPSLPVNADPLLLEQAVLNLLLNAAQAMQRGGRVIVSFGAGVGGRQLWLRVRDDGPGIAPRVLERMFDPFFTTRETGTGLGLAIVHRIVEAHDGTVQARNAEGGGACFEIGI